MTKITDGAGGEIKVEIEGTIFRLSDIEALKYQLNSRLSMIADNIKFESERFSDFGIKITASGDLKRLEGIQHLYSSMSQRLMVVFKNSSLKIDLSYHESQE